MSEKRRPLHEIVRDMKNLFWALAEADGPAPDIGDTLQAEMEGCNAELQDKVQACLSLACAYHAEGGMLKDRARIMAERSARLSKRAESLEAYIKSCLDSIGMDRYGTLDYPAIRIKRNPPRLEMDDDAVIPEAFIERVESIRVLKQQLKDAIKGGAEVAGCRLVQGTRLDY